MVAAANALDDRFQDAFNRADVDALMATYWNSPNLVSFGPDGMGTRGWEACKAAAQAMFPASVGQVVIDDTTLEIYLPNDAAPVTIDELRDFSLPTATGPLPLSEVATVEEALGPESITTIRGIRSATVAVTPRRPVPQRAPDRATCPRRRPPRRAPVWPRPPPIVAGTHPPPAPR